MNNNRTLINLHPGETFIHKLTGASKVRMFVLLIIFVIMSFDARLIFPLLIISTIALLSLKQDFNTYKWILLIVILMNAFNIFLYWLADPDVGAEYCNTTTIIANVTTKLFISKETLWYLFVRFWKMITSFMVSLVFILSITPSEFAAGLYSIKVPYKICTIVELAFRYIPDITRDYQNISVSMQCRGLELDPKKVSVFERLKQMILILVPLIISSFDRVGNIANAMDLRGFGKMKTRTYYSEHEEGKGDKIWKVLYIALLIFIVFYIVNKRINPPVTKMWYPFA